MIISTTLLRADICIGFAGNKVAKLAFKTLNTNRNNVQILEPGNCPRALNYSFERHQECWKAACLLSRTERRQISPRNGLERFQVEMG
jgi:hypothetical protein